MSPEGATENAKFSANTIWEAKKKEIKSEANSKSKKKR